MIRARPGEDSELEFAAREFDARVRVLLRARSSFSQTGLMEDREEIIKAERAMREAAERLSHAEADAQAERRARLRGR